MTENPDILTRLTHVEDIVHELQFSHMVKFDAVTNGLSIVNRRLERLSEDVAGFRAEVAAEFGILKDEQTRQGEEITQLKTDTIQVKETLAAHGQLLQRILDRLDRFPPG